MRRLMLCLVLLALGIFLMGCAQMSAEEIVKKVEEKYDAIRDMKGIVVITTNFQGKKKVEVTKFAMKKPDKYWSDSENYTMVSNGTVMWFYDKNRNEVIKINLPKEKPKFDYGELIKDLMKNTNIKLLGSEKISGRDCYVVKVIPKNKTFYVEQKLWIDKEYWYPLRIEINYGEFNSTIEYKDVKFNTGIPDSFFEFKLPKGAKVVEQEIAPPKMLTLEEAQKQVNFTIIVPKYTAGFKFDYAYVFKFGSKEMISLYYAKDDQRLVITESKGYLKMPLPNATKIDINGTTFEVAQVFGKNILRIRKGNFEVSISAKLPKEELIKIGKSIVESKEWKSIKGVEMNLPKLNVAPNTVFFFYSPYCPHCEEIKPYVTNLTKRYTNYKFVFCDVNNCNGTCKKVMEKYRIMFVPTIVVFGKTNTTILTGTIEIRNNLERVLNEG